MQDTTGQRFIADQLPCFHTLLVMKPTNLFSICRLPALLIVLFIVSSVRSQAQQTVVPTNTFNIKDFGARGDGKTVDTKAINDAIDAAVAKGGGTVYFPAGNYLSFSIHLKSNIGLYLEQGCTVTAADSASGGGNNYDEAETNANDKFQDFGHSHWHNSLIWGENL